MSAALPWRGYALAAACAAAGASAFAALELPLAFLLGPLTASLAATLLGKRPVVPERLRLGMLALLGIYVGSLFTPDSLAAVQDWPVTLASLLVLVALTTAAVAAYFHRFAGFDGRSAILGAVPGGLTVVLATAGLIGGDVRRIAIVQTLRILAVVYAGPAIALALAAGPASPASPDAARAWLGVLAAPGPLALVVAAAAAGYGLLKLLRVVPLPVLLGPLAGTAALGLLDMPRPEVPETIVLVVQLFLGTALGTRLAGLQAGPALRVGLHGLAATALTLVLALAATALLAGLTAFRPAELFLAFAPGGLAEMVLLAASLDVDAAFVTTHHLVRFLLIVLSLGWVARRPGRRP